MFSEKSHCVRRKSKNLGGMYTYYSSVSVPLQSLIDAVETFHFSANSEAYVIYRTKASSVLEPKGDDSELLRKRI